MHVFILQTLDSGKQKKILKFTLNGEKIKVENVGNYRGDYKDFLIDRSYILGQNAKKYTMDSGKKFLEQMKFHFKGSIIRATELIK